MQGYKNIFKNQASISVHDRKKNMGTGRNETINLITLCSYLFNYFKNLFIKRHLLSIIHLTSTIIQLLLYSFTQHN